MLPLLLQITVVACLAFVVFLLGRAVPRVGDEDVEKAREQSLFHWLVAYLEKADEWILGLVEKFLRRSRVSILKLDNAISAKLARFKKDAEKQTGFSGDKGDITKDVEMK